MVNILIDVPLDAVQLEQLQTMRDVHVEVIPFREEPEPLPADLVRDKQIIFCSYPPTNLDDCQALKWVQICSVGYSQLVNIGLPEMDVRATNAQGVFDVPIAEWNIAMMFQLTRDMRQMFRNQEQKIWDRSARFQAEIRGSKVGIWGYGGIGRETARLAKAMGMTVKVMVRDTVKQRNLSYCVPGTGDPLGKLPDEVYMAGQEEAFLYDLDFLIVAVPLTKHTEGMIDDSILRMLPATAYVLNPSRGPIIQEASLLSLIHI